MKQTMIAIVGPTASGKTRLSVELASHLGAEIISFDSMQIYRGMDIGTAKPDPEEQKGIPHHMIDVADPREDFSVSRYVEQADGILQSLLAQNKPVVLVGGTGLYIDSLISGREFAPLPQTGRREELTRIAREQGIEVLMEQLRSVDPESAERIHPSNEKRVIRALEIYLESGKTMTQHNLETQSKPPKYKPLWIGLDYVNREALYSRIDRRVERMLEQGLAQEVQQLLSQGIPDTATAMQAIGYKELVGYLQGSCTLEEAKETIQRSSRRYAKRQRTWFYRNPAVNWLMLEDEPNFEKVFLQTVSILSTFDKA
ncbi:MAG: tRNA (adenosine(37)-N6)-dimethylallyltransferase MiaA [Oscillospiraceae bacterium]|nr:tRNA (adenosine(37)-N6)-dimethylallyltransferase MiaA [Oscillospiraceae bacterium]